MSMVPAVCRSPERCVVVMCN